MDEPKFTAVQKENKFTDFQLSTLDFIESLEKMKACNSIISITVSKENNSGRLQLHKTLHLGESPY